MVFVCATVAGAPAGRVTVAFTAVTLYFVGTVLHVKARIRERGNATYRRVSVAYHLLAVLGAVWLGAALAALFALLAVRAWALPGRHFTLARIGVIEIVASLALLLAPVLG